MRCCCAFRYWVVIETRLLRAFRAVAEELHFGRAAERLHMSQPPLSLSIRQLEELLGAALFIRTTRQVQMTAAGEELLRHIRKMEQIHVEATTAIRHLASGMTGELTIALTPSAAYTPITMVLQSFRTQFPDIHLRLREMNSRDMADALLGGHVDAALARPFKFSSALTSQTVYIEPLYLSVPHSHVLATKSMITVEDLATLVLLCHKLRFTLTLPQQGQCPRRSINR